MSHIVTTEPEPIDTTDHTRHFAPTPEQEADQLGYSLVRAGEDPGPPEGWTLGLMIAFFDGIQDANSRAERDEYAPWMLANGEEC